KELFNLYKSFYKQTISTEDFKKITRFNDEKLEQFASKLSGGERRILDFALSIIGKPNFVILDEPTSAMDTEMRKHFWVVIDQMKKEGKTIFYTSHYIEEVERMADRVIVLNKGELIVDSTPREIRHSDHKTNIQIPLKNKKIIENLKDIEIEELKDILNIKTEDVNPIIRKLIENNVDFNEIEITKDSLMDTIVKKDEERNRCPMLWAYFKSEFILLSRKKEYLILSIMLTLVFYLIFTALLDLPKEYEAKFYKEYMFSMATFSLSSLCIMTFPLEMIEDKKLGWAKNLFKTPLSPIHYYAGKILKLMCMFCMSIIALFVTGALYKGVEMSIGEWIGSAILLWIGSSMFLSIGVLISQIKDIQKASAIANILYLGLAVIGGLWFPTDQFPNW